MIDLFILIKLQRGLFQNDSIIILFCSLADHLHQFHNNYFIQPFIRSIASIRKYFLHLFICSNIFFCSAVHPFDFILAKNFLHLCKNLLHLCIHLAIPFQTAWLSVSHPCACCAFIPEEHLRMRGHIYINDLPNHFNYFTILVCRSRAIQPCISDKFLFEYSQLV